MTTTAPIPDVPAKYLATAATAVERLKLQLVTLYHDRPGDRETAHLVLNHASHDLAHSLSAWIGNAADHEFGPAYGAAEGRVAMLGTLARHYERAAMEIEDLFRAWYRGAWPNRAEGAPTPYHEQEIPL